RPAFAHAARRTRAARRVREGGMSGARAPAGGAREQQGDRIEYPHRVLLRDGRPRIEPASRLFNIWLAPAFAQIVLKIGPIACVVDFAESNVRLGARFKQASVT
ncbi:hypothetical protein, partial [Burkholderia humptydooensis]|uniref:hypothetical protein n=1 Tax=Burkholderia humptydooensis TaxID=430531 RepID=UPI0012FDECA9